MLKSNRSVLYFKFILAVFLLFTGSVSLACADDGVNQWNVLLSRFKLSKDLRAFLDLQPRFGVGVDIADSEISASQFLVRPALGYQWSDSLQTYLGYTLVENYNPHRTDHDVFQDILYADVFGPARLTLRQRTEQRFLDGIGEISHRWRYLTQVAVPVASADRTSLVLNNELFFVLNEVSPALQSGFVENRAFIGLSKNLSADLSLTGGYMNQYRERRGGSKDPVDHILLLFLVADFDLSL